MKTIDERELQKTTKEKQRQKGARGTEALVKGWELNDFYYNTPCNRFYNNYVINICPRQLWWLLFRFLQNLSSLGICFEHCFKKVFLWHLVFYILYWQILAECSLIDY